MTAITGHAASDMIVDGVTYEWSPTELGYIATGWAEVTPIQSLHIRSEVDGLDVVGIASSAFENNEDIVFLTIDEGIRYISQNAFCRCTNLEVAILPEGLLTIEEEAFAFCSKLSTMAIPSTVKEIQAHAFSGCTGVTDVYFLMDGSQLENFNWWDGVFPAPGEELHGGMEFNESRLEGHNPESGTHIHVPNGLYDNYYNSGKFEAWLLEEDDGCYPLWWIVNYGVVGRTYTVCDELMAVYTDVNYNLYVKDDNHWLTPDRIYPGENDYMRSTTLMSDKDNIYDQSNWVVLSELLDPESYNGHMIQGATITGKLIDKKNPVIEITSTPPVQGEEASYIPNLYIPSAFMGRSQRGTVVDKTFAFVQPKPQEYIRVDWAVYHVCIDENEFYFAEPNLEQGINRNGLYGGFMANYQLYENPPHPTLEQGGYYAFPAINRLNVAQEWQAPPSLLFPHNPYVDGGLSTHFTVYPLSLPDEPIITSVTSVTDDTPQANQGWYSIDGRYLGSQKPKERGIYIHNGTKLVIKP